MRASLPTKRPGLRKLSPAVDLPTHGPTKHFFLTGASYKEYLVEATGFEPDAWGIDSLTLIEGKQKGEAIIKK